MQERGATLGAELDSGNVKRVVFPLEVSDKAAPDASSGHGPTETRGGRLLSIHPPFINFSFEHKITTSSI